MTRRLILSAAAAAPFAMALPAHAATPAPTLTLAPGQPDFDFGKFDLAGLGYQVEEYFISGTAASYRHDGPYTVDGRWNAAPAAAAPYVTRLLIVRPSDAKRFSGCVIVEWMNVSGGRDAAPDWTYAHREIMRGGRAWVGVSAQKVGVDGGAGLIASALPLKKANPRRYGQLSHPGDAFSFDIFSQAGAALRRGQGLGSLRPRRVLATGESQSATFMTTYVNAVDPLAQVYDGFLVHSRFAGAARLDGARPRDGRGAAPDVARFRDDLRAPVIAVISETDLLGLAGAPGYFSARQPDRSRLRVWEIPGTAHADIYAFAASRIDGGDAKLADLAVALAPTNQILGGAVEKPANAAPQHHYVMNAAIHHLDRWAAKKGAPPHAAPMSTVAGAAQPPVRLARDAHGNTLGGIRSPWLDAPMARYSGEPNSGGALGFLVGFTEPFSVAKLNSLYPRGRADYLRRFTSALESAIAAGFILPADRDEIVGIAEATAADAFKT